MITAAFEGMLVKEWKRENSLKLVKTLLLSKRTMRKSEWTQLMRMIWRMKTTNTNLPMISFENFNTVSDFIYTGGVLDYLQGSVLYLKINKMRNLKKYREAK